MAEQIVLKHLREAITAVPLHQLEVELRLSRQLTAAMFEHLETCLSSCTAWQGIADSETCDRTCEGIRVTNDRAICKRRVAFSDAGNFRIATSHEEPVPLPATFGETHTRHKRRRERGWYGWKVATTVVNPDSSHPGFEVEVELDTLWLVRHPLEVLAATGTRLMEDVVKLTEECPTSRSTKANGSEGKSQR